MKTWVSVVTIFAGILALGLSGCASHTYVQQIQEQVEANRADISMLQKSDEEQNEKLSKLSETVVDALARVEKMRALAEGRFLFETTLNDSELRFAFDRSQLTAKAREELDNFARRLKEENKDCYVEIQGHTDNVGTPEYNYALGLARARAVMSYLHLQHNIPLNRMNTFSYGETKPVALNADGPQERAKNRRVTLVVMT
ncbi:MAG: OmpA family protein [Syntrophobacteria bacterium]